MRVSSTPTPVDEPLPVVPRRVLEDAPASEPASAIRRVMAGERVLDPAPAGRLRPSAGTVRNDLSSAMQKLGAHSRAEAIKVAEDKGWL